MQSENLSESRSERSEYTSEGEVDLGDINDSSKDQFEVSLKNITEVENEDSSSFVTKNLNLNLDTENVMTEESKVFSTIPPSVEEE